MKLKILAILSILLLLTGISFGDQLTISGIPQEPSAKITGGTIDNTPIGATTPSTGAFTTLSVTQNFNPTQGSDVASANAMTLGNGNLFDITGTTTINTIVSKGVGSIVILQFDGILQLTHSNDLFLPTAANITTAAGDIAVFYEYATGDWRCMSYMRADGTVLYGYQPLAAALTSISGLTETNGGIPYGTADNTYAWLAAGAEGTLLMGNGAGAPSWLAAGTAGYHLVANGAADPVWTAPTGTGSPVNATSPTLVTPILGTPTSGTLTNCTGLPEGGLTLTDVTTKDVSTSAHGFAPKAPATNKQHLQGLDGTWADMRDFSTLYLTNGGSQRTLTEAELLANYFITNNGDSAESDIKLPALSYSIKCEVREEEGFGIEICPPTDEQMGDDNDDTLLTINHCVTTGTTKGNRVIIERMLGSDGSTWHWSVITISGVNTTGAAD